LCEGADLKMGGFDKNNATGEKWRLSQQKCNRHLWYLILVSIYFFYIVYTTIRVLVVSILVILK
jgi:hypothetical protein